MHRAKRYFSIFGGVLLLVGCLFFLPHPARGADFYVDAEKGGDTGVMGVWNAAGSRVPEEAEGRLDGGREAWLNCPRRPSAKLRINSRRAASRLSLTNTGPKCPLRKPLQSE
jgi:hypothetical protein